MTDYLELLLDVWQEEEDEGFVWPRWSAGRRGTAEESALQQGAEKRRAEESEATGVRHTQAEETRMKAGNPLGQMEALERAVARSKAAQAGRERKSPGTAEMQVGGVRGMGRVETALPGVRRSLTGLLDVAFERDARRYDGPLGLF